MQLARRRFLQLAATAAAGAFSAAHPLVVQAAQELPGQMIAYAGTDLNDWSVVLGDGIWAASNEAPVNAADIATTHLGDWSELRANVSGRRVEAHNITHQSVLDPCAMDYVHVVEYDFRIPYVPTKEYAGDLNAQTMEGGLGLWDGHTTRIKYGIGFQWGLNPYAGLGELRAWTGLLAAGWQPAGHLEPDTQWHHLRIVADFRADTALLAIDGQPLSTVIGKCPAPSGWGSEVAVGPSAEIISIYPGEEGRGALHVGQVRNWVWHWEPQATRRVFLPTILR